ncbi:translation initiation factor IF-2 N-terminal domain-containing protein, partial [Slackia equolifaciens]
MASMRVHELAKEFGMDSKELLSRIQGMKIPAKSHASMLTDAHVEQIRKAIVPELSAKVAAKIDPKAAEVAKAEAEKKAEEKAEVERARREAVERERAQRDAERARRG